MLKRILAALMCGTVMAAAVTGCGKKITVDDNDETVQIDISRFSDRKAPSIDYENSEIKNFSAIEDGEQIIVMTIKGYGEVKIRLFPEYAEKGVENFVGHAKDGYYDGLTFHRVISDFMIQGGNPEGTGRGGESIWGGKFEGGTDSHLIHAAGAIAYANSGATSTNGSQFYLVTGTLANDDMFAQYEQYGYTFSEDAKDIYKSVGGTPHLDGGYTVFGQIFDGLDIIYAAQDVDTTTTTNSADALMSPDKPIDDLIIESVRVEEYNGEETKWFISDYQ